MSEVLAFVAARRKALGYIVAALAEYVTTLLPQANPGNAQVLHGVVLLCGFLLVYLPSNDVEDPSVSQLLDSLVKGDTSPPKHEAPPDPPTEPSPRSDLPPVPIG